MQITREDIEQYADGAKAHLFDPLHSGKVGSRHCWPSAYFDPTLGEGHSAFKSRRGGVRWCLQACLGVANDYSDYRLVHPRLTGHTNYMPQATVHMW